MLTIVSINLCKYVRAQLYSSRQHSQFDLYFQGLFRNIVFFSISYYPIIVAVAAAAAAVAHLFPLTIINFNNIYAAMTITYTFFSCCIIQFNSMESLIASQLQDCAGTAIKKET